MTRFRRGFSASLRQMASATPSSSASLSGNAAAEKPVRRNLRPTIFFILYPFRPPNSTAKISDRTNKGGDSDLEWSRKDLTDRSVKCVQLTIELSLD